MKTILACTDFSDVSGRIIDYSISLGGAFNLKVYVVHVAAPEPDFVGNEAGPQKLRDIRADELTEKHKQLFNLKEKIQNRGVEAEALLIQGKTVEEIFSMAEKINAEFIVIGSRKHGVLHKAFRGSVLHSVLSDSNIPLVVIPQEKDEG